MRSRLCEYFSETRGDFTEANFRRSVAMALNLLLYEEIESEEDLVDTPEARPGSITDDNGDSSEEFHHNPEGSEKKE